MTGEIQLTLLDPVVEGAVNLRDLGGLVAGGHVVRRGRIFRSGMMHCISEPGLAALGRDHHIRTVIDFRNAQELEGDGLSNFDSSGLRYIHLPIIDSGAVAGNDGTAPASAQESLELRRARMRELMDGTLSWSTSYRGIIEKYGASYVRFFETLAAPGTLAAVFHCAAGRDRTGIGAALLLDILGVDEETIVHDYHATGAILQPHAHRYVRLQSEMGWTTDEIGRLLMTHPAAMTEFLTFLREDFGGAEAYMVANGLDPAVLTELRGQLLERA